MSIDTFIYDIVAGDTIVPSDYVSYSNHQTHRVAQEYSTEFYKIYTGRRFANIGELVDAFGKAVADVEFSNVVKDTFAYEMVIEYLENVHFYEIAKRYANITD